MASDWDDLERRVRGAIESTRSVRRDLREACGDRPVEGVPFSPADTSLTVAAEPALAELIEALDAFPTLVSYLNSRRTTGGVTTVQSEADVQDLLYLSLKPLFSELVYEQPTEKGAAGYSIGDFTIPSLRLILEAKYVEKKADVKAKADEISEDIWKYTTQTDCERVIFLVYDPHLLIPDRPNWTRSLSTAPGEFKTRGREVEILTVIKP